LRICRASCEKWRTQRQGRIGDVFGFLTFRTGEDRLSPANRAGLRARRLAVRVLAGVLKQRKPFDEAWDRASEDTAFASLEARDRAFARAIVMMALRRAGQLRAIVSKFIQKPLPPGRGQIDEILLCAAAQLVFLKSAPHAVIDLAVHQVREDEGARRFHKLANAVLRRVSEQGEALALQQDAAQMNTPDWLWSRWSKVYGPEEAHHIAAQHLAEPPLDLTVKADADAWADRLNGVVLPTGSVRIAPKGRVEELDGFGEGVWWVQDAAAALPARLMGDVAGKAVADLCAAPGGKTAQLAQAGAKVWAVDQSGLRLDRLKANLKRLGLEAETHEADATQWMPPEPLDAVLLDAPCSATGTIRRHPDVAHLKRPEDVNELAQLQHRLMVHALDMLKPGGTLLYCTCSLEPAEGTEQVARILGERADLRLAPFAPDDVAGRGEWLDAQGALRTLPHYLQLSDPELSGMDGFYAARLIKSA
jgi:16S rRNA (cytosine967-C5)-methyltransferase